MEIWFGWIKKLYWQMIIVIFGLFSITGIFCYQADIFPFYHARVPVPVTIDKHLTNKQILQKYADKYCVGYVGEGSVAVDVIYSSNDEKPEEITGYNCMNNDHIVYSLPKDQTSFVHI